MNISRSSILSIAISAGILLFSFGIYRGGEYLEECFIKSNVTQMLSVYQSIPNPIECDREVLKIEKRWIVKSVVADRFYSDLSTEDGKSFFTNYANKNSWEIIENQYYDSMNEYYLTIQKGKIKCFFIHREGAEKWRIRIVKEDIFMKLGL